MILVIGLDLASSRPQSSVESRIYSNSAAFYAIVL